MLKFNFDQNSPLDKFTRSCFW